MNAFFLFAVLFLQQAAPPRPAGTIVGRVTYADGTPYTGHFIVAETVSDTGKPIERSSPKITSVEPTGEFRFTDLPPGRYSIRTGDSSYPDIITITAASGPQTLNIVLPAALTGFRVSGRVILPPKQPNPPTEVEGSFESQYVYGPIAADG